MKSIHIVADENMPNLKALLEKVEGLVVSLELMPGRAIQCSHLREADVLLVRSVTQVNEALLAGSPVKFVGSATTGLEHVDQGYLQEKGIHFCSAFGINANAVAEYVISAITSLSQIDGKDYFDRTVAVVGYGNVGKALVSKLEAMGSGYKVYDPLLEQQSLKCDVNFTQWQDILECQLFSFHVPYTRRGQFPTHRMMNKAFFEKVSTDSVIINAARGEICDEQALLSAIEEKQLRCVLDVWQNEPEISAELLQKIPLATPHIAGYSLDAKVNASLYVIKDLLSFLSSPNKQFALSDDSSQQYPEKQLRASNVSDCILQAYNPVNDSEQLKKSLKDACAQSFDELRKHYQHRLEWKHYHVNAALSESELKILEALGFSLGKSCA